MLFYAKFGGFLNVDCTFIKDFLIYAFIWIDLNSFDFVKKYPSKYPIRKQQNQKPLYINIKST